MTYSVLVYAGHKLPEAYCGMVYAKWLRSQRHGNDFMRLIDPKAYYKAYHKHLTHILGHPMTQVRLAALSDDHDVVLGFSVSRGTILDYIHVHKDNRRLGIGTALIPKGIDTISSLTKTGLTIWGSKYGEWKFDPFS